MYKEDFLLNDIKRLLLNYVERETKDNRSSSSRKNINPKKWGPPAWQFIDAIIAGYPAKPNKREINKMTDFMHSLSEILPCSSCRKNIYNFTTKYPPDKYSTSRIKVRKWFKLYKSQGKK